MENSPLHISKRNRRGLVVIVLILLAVVYFPRLLTWLNFNEKLPVSVEYISEVKQAIAKEKTTFKRSSFENKKSSFTPPPSKFDPNSYTVNDWMKLGLSEKQAAIILKFNKYGFKSNDDLKRIFVINDELFALIKDSTFYPERPQKTYSNNEKPRFESEKPKAPEKVEINSADEEKLKTIKGIGPFFAKQIIRQRDKLGGFYSKDQLSEVWKITPEALVALEEGAVINPDKVTKLSINRATVDELKSHPYLNWNQANSIVKMREQRGGFKKIEEIKESKLIDEDTYRKIVPYLSL